MATGNTIKCPNCGAPIENTSDESKVKCLYCGSIVEVPSEIEEEDWNQLSAAIGGLAAAISGDVTPKFLPPKIDDKECENKILEKLVLTDLVPLDIFESFKLEDIKHTFCPLYVFEVNWSADWSATFTTQVSHQERTYDYNGNPNGTRTVWETKYRDATGTSAGNLIVVLPASDEQKEMLATIIDHFKLSAYRRKVATEPNPNGYDSWDVVPVKCNSSEAWENNKSTAEKQIEQNVDDGCCNSASSRANGWSVSNLQYTWGYRMTSKQCVQIPVCSTKYKYNDALHGVIIDANDGTAILEKPPQSKDDVNYIKELATQNSKYKRMMIGWYIVSGIFVSIAITVFVVFLLDPIPLSAYGSMAKVGCIITIITFFIARRSHELKLNANNDNATFLFEKKTARKEAVKRKYKIDVNIGKAPEKKKTSRVLDFVVYGILLLLIIISSTVGSSKDNHRNVSYDESPVEEKVYEAPVLEETEETFEAIDEGMTEETIDEENVRLVAWGFVDLGLPSGTIWKDENESGFYDYDVAVRSFGSKLPTEKQFEELKNKCRWTWTGSGYNVAGPNGNSLFLPAEGKRYCSGDVSSDVGTFGYYWLSTPGDGTEYASILFFNGAVVKMASGERCCGRSVRLVQ